MYLHKIGYVDTPLCSFCSLHNETMRHLFWECQFCQIFWVDVQTIILQKQPFFREIEILLGFLEKDNSIYNFLIFHAKYFIFRCKLQEVKPCISHFLNIFQFSLQVEKDVLSKSINYDKFINLIECMPAYISML